MRDEHLTPVLAACSEAELALLIEFLGRPPSGLLWLDRRALDPSASHDERVAAVVAEVMRYASHSVAGRIGAGSPSWVQIVCDVLHEFEVSEAPAQGITGLELRVVRHVLDTEFERLPADLQEELLAGFFAGELFVGGLRGYDPLQPFLTRIDKDHRALGVGKLTRAMRKIGENQLAKRAGTYVRRKALRMVLRRLAGPVQWVLTAWDWLGPAFRVTVPVICYVAYLRHAQQARASAGDGAGDAGDAAGDQALAAS